MEAMSFVFVSATPSFPVENVAASTDFYTTRLGFEPIFQTKLRTLLVRDSVGLLLRQEPRGEAPRTAQCRIGVQGVKALHRQLSDAGLLGPECLIKRTDYGKDEFNLADPDGNTITFFSA